VQYNKFLHVAIMTSRSMVNIQTHTHTSYDSFRPVILLAQPAELDTLVSKAAVDAACVSVNRSICEETVLAQSQRTVMYLVQQRDNVHSQPCQVYNIIHHTAHILLFS